MKKFLCGTIIATTILLPLLGSNVLAKSDYGSTVHRNYAKTYGFAWTTSDGVSRARIVICGNTSDKTRAGYVQTEQVSGTRFNDAYCNHYVDGSLIASYTK